MNLINDDLWKAFKQLAEKYPDDQGIRMAADLARWVEEHYQRLASDAVVSPNELQVVAKQKKKKGESAFGPIPERGQPVAQFAQAHARQASRDSYLGEQAF